MRNPVLSLLLFCALLAGACFWSACAANKANLRQARSILKTTPVVDTHIDFPWHLVEHNKWFKPGYTAWALDNPDGNFDYKRAIKGGLYGPFMSIYIPAKYQTEPGRSKQVADSLIDIVNDVAKAYPDKFALVTRAADIETNFKKGIISLPMGMENGAPIEALSDVAYFHRRGIRYITLTHSRDNKICDSSYDTKHTHGGLSEYGREVVREMNRSGIMVDVSHLSDATIWDLMNVVRKPLIATHSGCRHFTPGFERNLSDSLIIAVAKTKGVIQVPFSMYFLEGKSRAAWQKLNKEIEEKKIPEGKAAKKYAAEYAKRTKEPLYLSAKTVADHIDHIVKLVGVDYVGFGSDFDGVGIVLPPDLDDVSMYPNLIAELLRRGYSEADIKKMCYQNVLRVWKANE